MTNKLLQLLDGIFTTCTEKFGNETSGQIDCLTELGSEAREMKQQLQKEGEIIHEAYRIASEKVQLQASTCYAQLAPLIDKMKIFDSIVCIPPRPVK